MICFEVGEHDMEEVLKKAEAEAEHLEEKAVQIGESAEKNKRKLLA